MRSADRELFALCVRQGLDLVAVAEALGLPLGAARSRLSRARGRPWPRRPPGRPRHALRRTPSRTPSPASAA
ncbi:sigma factor-like helix-turn-helix DNA-binding protein [Streptacidiphilus anmyonensis]|uniref:sigma factor-like helix-turn-helix DNA-binding protein n=1 Tax=Streptacidiphilus anmyonensis TaxID=405782 RepID=UPI003F71730C